MALTDLRTLALSDRERYLAVAPWPHLVLDGLIDQDLIATAESEELSGALHLRVSKSRRQIKSETTQVTGPAAKEILQLISTQEFIDFLELLTGISGLFADPTLFFGGLHVGPPGAFQALHRDFRMHPTTKMFHRVNVLVYLNSDWKKEYGGELELWKKNGTDCEAKILPTAGRVVIFETTSRSIHGVPDPIRCPPGRARLSLASYYYAQTPGPDDRMLPYFSRPKRPQDPWFVGLPAPGDVADEMKRKVRRSLQRIRSER